MNENLFFDRKGPFLVKDLFYDKSDKNNDGQDDAAYNNKFHGL